MNKIIRNIMVYFIVNLLCCNYVLSQSAKELEEKKRQANEDIEYAGKLLKEIEKNKILTIEKVSILERKIDAHNSVINTINREIDEVDERIRNNKELIKSLEEELKKLKNEYARMIYYAYINSKSSDRMMFILASKSFDQAYRRMKYLQQYTKFRKEQAEVIVKAQKVIHENIIDLEAYKTKKEKLVYEKEREQNNISKEIKNKEKTINEMGNEVKRLKIEIEEKKAVAYNLEREIKRMIEEERKKYAGNMVKLTPEEKIIADNFKKNRGKLPWPTERGIVTEKFGEHKHPVLKDITIRNNGIDIATISGSDVRAVFSGTVTKVIAILGANYTVIIKHGEYYSVYQNLVDISVKQGQTVEIKQKIGKVFTDKNSNKTLLHVEIWENLTKLDPELWLSY